MADKQLGRYVHHVTWGLSFSDKEGWEAKRSPLQHAGDLSEEQLAGFSPHPPVLPRAPPAGGVMAELSARRLVLLLGVSVSTEACV